MDKRGGIYFTDPRYGQNRDDMEQDGEHVYYLSPNRKKLTRVANDLVRPNGVLGTPDGKTLYIADHGGGKTFAYDIASDGSLLGILEPLGSSDIPSYLVGTLSGLVHFHHSFCSLLKLGCMIDELCNLGTTRTIIDDTSSILDN